MAKSKKTTERRGPCRFCAALSHTHDKLAVAETVEIAPCDFELRIGGIRPTDEQLKELVSEAELLTKTALWGILTATVRSRAVDMGIRSALNFDHTLLAKACLHVVGVQESTVDAIRKEHVLRSKPKV